MNKKIISIILAAILCLSMVLPAAADPPAFTDAASIQHPEAVARLVADGIINGYPDGTFRPENTLTRAEACAMMTRLMGGTPAGTAEFDDVAPAHWAAGYIAYCAAEGIVAGYGNGAFGPGDTLTGEQWSRMLLAALGYDAEESGLLGSAWQLGVAELSSAEDLYSGLSHFVPDQPISRDDACQIAYQGMYAPASAEPSVPVDTNAMLSSLSYTFANTRQGFAYPLIYRIPLERYQMIFGDHEKTNVLYQMAGKWIGNCFGISGTSEMFWLEGNNVQTENFRADASVPFDLALSDWNSQWEMSLTEFIEAVQVSQLADPVQKTLWDDNVDDLARLCTAVVQFQETGANPVILGLRGAEGGHALAAYALVDVSATESHLLVYDSNYPNDSTRYITISKDDAGQPTGWEYQLTPTVTWDSGAEKGAISYITYQDYYQVWENRGQNDISGQLLLTTNQDITITNSKGEPIAEIQDHNVTAHHPDVYPLVDLGIRLDALDAEDMETAGTTSVWLPVEGYTIQQTGEPAEDFEVTVTHVQQSAKVTTEADAVTVTVDDATKTRTVSLDQAEEGSNYEITVRSSFDTEEEPEEMTLTGSVTGETLAFGQEDGEVVVKGADVETGTLTIDGAEMDLPATNTPEQDATPNSQDSQYGNEPEPEVQTEQPESGVSAIFYNDGTLVFQNGNTPDASRGSVRELYPVELESGYELDTMAGNAGRFVTSAPWGEVWNEITTVVFSDTIRPESTAAWFYGLGNLTDLEQLENLDTQYVTSMWNMFGGCGSLETLDLSAFDTGTVANMESMFAGDAKLTTIYASRSFTTTQVLYSGDMFTGCIALVGGNGTAYDRSYTDKTYARLDTGKTRGYFTQNQDTIEDEPSRSEDADNDSEHVYAILYDDGTMVFQYGNTPDTTLGTVEEQYLVDLTGKYTVEWYTDERGTVFDDLESYVTTAPWGAARDQIRKIVFADPIQPTSLAYWFCGCSELTEFSQLENLDTALVREMCGTFAYCTGLTNLDLRPFDTSHVTDMSMMFLYCSNLTELNVSGFDTRNVTDMASMFSNCHSLTNLDLSGFDTRNVTYMASMFYCCPSLTNLNLSGFDTQNVKYMQFMFGECTSLANLDLSNFNTQNVNSMGAMFTYCSSLESLDLSGFDTRNVTTMGHMFYYCTSLINLDLSSFDTQYVRSMDFMFYDCTSLTNLDLSSFNTQDVASMEAMFQGCSSLESLNLSGFDTLIVENMDYMFSYCSSLTNLDLSSFDTRNVTNAVAMFADNEKLVTITVSTDFVVNSADHSEMFRNCTSLVGGNGTKYDEDHIDGTYARIDTANEPGYFTSNLGL